MARIRQVKPEFWHSLTIAALPRLTRLHFIALWNYADDHGRGVDEPRLIKAAAFPLDDDVTLDEIEDHQRLLATSGRIVRYVVDGRNYFEVVNWAEHQYVQRPQRSRLPPSDSRTVHEASMNAHEPSGQGQGSGVRGQVTGEAAPEGAMRSLLPDIVEDRRDDVDALCDLLAGLVETNGCRRPEVTRRWREEARRLIDKDGVPAAEAERVMRWALSDDFWRSNILSMPTFRKQFDRLRLQAGRNEPRKVSKSTQTLIEWANGEQDEQAGSGQGARVHGGSLPKHATG